MAVFREFPYLYAGDPEYETAYLRTYVETPDSLCVLAMDGDQAVGASTGLPLADEVDELQAPLRDHGYDIERTFYFGESVLLPAYRGQGIGRRFFEVRERFAREPGRFRQAVFCAVVRPESHPRRPPDYVPLHGFWERRGFRRVEGPLAWFAWPDLDDAGATPKPLEYWLKPL